MARRLRKLQAMSPKELVHRVRYAWLVRREREAHRAGTLAPENRLQAALVPALRGADWEARLLTARQTATGRVFPSIAAQAEMRELFRTRYTAEHADMRVRAAEARAQRFSFFGQTFTYGSTIPWQDDPVTAASWPSRFHADVPVHRGDIGAGDVKHVWELSRQQYLIDLGRAVFVDDDPASLEALQRLVRSWIAGNPYATGVNWACALEPAFRGISWLLAYAMTAPRLSPEFHLEWLRGLYDHARFIERHLEHYSSPYNHLLGEAAALYLFGAWLPEFADAPRWRAVAREVLETRLDEQFYADGGTVEQSTFYHHASVGDYLLAVLAARRIGEDFSPAVWGAIERGLEFSAALLQPDGRTPEIGGADDGKPIRFEHLPLWDFRSYLAIGAVLFQRPDLKALATRFHEDALWLLGPEGLRAFDALPAERPGRSHIALPHSGYYVMRSGWTPHGDYVCIDCGEQAAGMRPDGVPNSMHGHADCLSVLVTLGGRRVLIDSGFFAYNCGGAWEAHFRETAAHNTARVDGRDQARHLGKMAWSHSYRPRPEGWAADALQAWFIGSHDGYARDAAPVTHRRAVRLCDGYVLVVDEFTGTGPHALEVNFQFAPGQALTVDGTCVRYGDVAALWWRGTVDWVAVTACGGASPEDGWVAPSLGVRTAAPRLSLRADMREPRTLLTTVLAPLGSAAYAVTSDDAGNLVVRGPGFTDTVQVGRQATLPEGLVTVTRTTDDGGERVDRIGASSDQGNRTGA